MYELLTKQNISTTPLGVLQLGSGVNNELKLTITDTEIQVDLNGNTFPTFKGVGGANETNEIYEHAKFFHQSQEGGFLEDSYYNQSMSETTQSVADKIKLFDYVDTIGEH